MLQLAIMNTMETNEKTESFSNSLFKDIEDISRTK